MSRRLYPRPFDPPREWEKAEDVAMHFNDLLMRIRTFALPFIATAIGAGAALGAEADLQIEISWGILASLSASAAVVFFLFAWTVYVARPPNLRLRVTWLEVVGFILIVLTFAVWAGMIGVRQPDSFLFSAPVLTFGGLLLFSIYLLDRFYYTALLIGAVNRAEKIETSLGNRINLSHEISFAAPHWTYTILPTALYLIPVVILLNIGLATAVFSGDEPCPPTTRQEQVERADGKTSDEECPSTTQQEQAESADGRTP